jgi:hypothetical protein
MGVALSARGAAPYFLGAFSPLLFLLLVARLAFGFTSAVHGLSIGRSARSTAKISGKNHNPPADSRNV